MTVPRLNEQQPTFEDLELLVEVSRLLTDVDLNSVLDKVIQLTSQSVRATKTSLFLHDHHQIDWGHIFTARPLSADESVKVVTRVMDEGFAGWVYRHQRGDIIYDTLDDDRWIVFADDTMPVRSALCVPFVDEGRVIAIITLMHSDPYHFTDYHLRLMTIIANQATIAIRNARLFQTINHQRRQLEIVLSAMSDVLLVLKHDGQILLVNHAALPLLQIHDVAEATGKLLADFAVVDTVFEALLEKLAAGTLVFEIRSDRLQTDFRVTIARWQDEQRGAEGYVIVMHDITTLEDLHRFKDEMLRVATHDLRSPLALVAGYADIIGMDIPPENTALHEYIDIIKLSVERMSNMVEEVLKIERIRNSELLRVSTDIEPIVKVVLVNMRLLASAKQHQITAEISLQGAPKLNIDAVLVRQAMENLIANAIKYTPPNGKIHVQAYIEAEKFHFSVQDNGIGIAKEHLPYLFESFYRVNTISDVEKGSGLGLSLVKNVIRRHQGNVWVKSRPGRGSKFGFWLPLTEANDNS